jgi:methylated-DNA-[protein]-cysteine S-methyltransferase
LHSADNFPKKNHLSLGFDSLQLTGDGSMSLVVHYQTPIGLLKIEGSAAAIERVDFIETPQPESSQAKGCLAQCITQLDEYFNNQRRVFDLPLAPRGTAFQGAVWQVLQTVPFGQTASYGDIARLVNRPKAGRAVGAANGRNPISIIIPCHRIIGANGTLTGYGGGLWRKIWLLEHEGLLIRNQRVS